MSRRHATVTQADVARIVRAAKQAGAAEVEVTPDGRIVVRLYQTAKAAPDNTLDAGRELTL